MIKIVYDLTTVKCTKDARRWLQKFALHATKLRRNVKALSAGCCDSLLLLLIIIIYWVSLLPKFSSCLQMVSDILWMVAVGILSWAAKRINATTPQSEALGSHSHILMTRGSECFFWVWNFGQKWFFGVYERRRDFFGSWKKNRDFFGLRKKD